MDAQGTMRLMFDTMDAYDRADFDRLGEIYAECIHVGRLSLLLALAV